MKRILTLSLVILLITNLTYAQRMKTLQDSLVVSQKDALALIKRMHQAKILSKAGKAHFEDMVTSQKPEDLYKEYIEAYRNTIGHFVFPLQEELLPQKRSIAVSELLRRLSFIESIYNSSKESYMKAMGDAKTEKFNTKIKGFCGDFLLNFLEKKPQYVTSLHQKLQEIGVLPTRIKLPFVLEKRETPLFIENYFHLVGESVYFFESYEKLKEEQIYQLIALKNEGILTASNYEKLINGYTPYQIYSETDVLMLCEKAVVIDLEDSTNNTTHFLEKIKTTIFPDMQFKIVGTYHDTITTEYQNKIGGEYIKVMLGEQEYHTSNVPLNYGGWVVYPPLSAINAEGVSLLNVQVFNDYLMDKGSYKRLHQMTDEVSMEGLRANFVARSKIGFILLDSTTLEKVPFFKKIYRNNERNAYLKNTLQRAEIKAFVTQLSALHLIKNTNVEEVVIKLIRDEARSYERILWALPHIVVKLDRLERCYECEEEDDMQPSFKQYMADFAQISRLQFLPTEVKETKISDKEYKLSFVWKDKQYEKSMNLPARFYSSMEGMSEMTAWINDALGGQKATGKFYYLSKYSFDALYLTPAQHTFLSQYVKIDE